MKKLKEKQEKILGDKKVEKEDENEDTCIICRQPNSVAPLYYLCKLKLTNVLGFALTKQMDPYLVLSTCGHKIHEGCLS